MPRQALLDCLYKRKIVVPNSDNGPVYNVQKMRQSEMIEIGLLRKRVSQLEEAVFVLEGLFEELRRCYDGKCI